MRIVLRISRPRIVRRIGLNGGGGGAGVSDHDDLGNLGWTVAAHTGSALGLAGWDGAGVAAVVASTTFGRSLLNAANADAGRTALSAQAASVDLTAIAAVNTGFGYLTRDSFGGWDLATIAGTLPIEITDGGATSPTTTISVRAASESAAGVVQLAASGGTTAGQAVQASDARLAKGAAFALLQLNADTAVTNMPAADTELYGTERCRALATLTGYTHARIVVRRGTGAATAGSTIRAQYTTDITGATGWTDLGPSVDMTAGNTRHVSTRTAIDAGAIAGSAVLLRAVTSGGNGVDDPTISQVQIEVS